MSKFHFDDDEDLTDSICDMYTITKGVTHVDDNPVLEEGQGSLYINSIKRWFGRDYKWTLQHYESEPRSVSEYDIYPSDQFARVCGLLTFGIAFFGLLYFSMTTVQQ